MKSPQHTHTPACQRAHTPMPIAHTSTSTHTHTRAHTHSTRTAAHTAADTHSASPPIGSMLGSRECLGSALGSCECLGHQLVHVFTDPLGPQNGVQLCLHLGLPLLVKLAPGGEAVNHAAGNLGGGGSGRGQQQRSIVVEGQIISACGRGQARQQGEVGGRADRQAGGRAGKWAGRQGGGRAGGQAGSWS